MSPPDPINIKFFLLPSQMIANTPPTISQQIPTSTRLATPKNITFGSNRLFYSKFLGKCIFVFDIFYIFVS